MTRISKPVTVQELYEEFLHFLSTCEIGKWWLAIFEGSPCEGAYSWCPDCISAYDDLRRFTNSYQGSVRVVQLKVGRKEEWEEKRKLNPFKSKFPFLSDLPTAVLFDGRLDVARIIAPRGDDLLYLCNRVKTYEEQIRAEVWHPPA